MSVQSTAGAWLLSVAVLYGPGSPAAAQGADPLPIASRRVVQSYTTVVDASFTRLAAPWSMVGVPALPCRVLAQSHLRPLLDELWALSVTFRQQCRRLAGARAVVLLQGASAAETVWNAESRIGLQADGGVMARVRVRLGRESVEVIAHELEHVLERIDGVHLALDAMRPASGTTLAGGAYETRRATEAGRRVAREVRQAAGRP
jgi:hypothetical protein